MQAAPSFPLFPSVQNLRAARAERRRIALTLRTRDRLSRNCYARDARAPVNAMRKDFSFRQTPSVRRAGFYLVGPNVRSLHSGNRLFDVSLLNRPGAELGDRQKIA